MKYADFKDFVADKVKQPQKGYGKREFDPRLLKKIYELLSGHDVTWDGKNYTIHDVEHSPRAMARKGRNPALSLHGQICLIFNIKSIRK